MAAGRGCADRVPVLQRGQTLIVKVLVFEDNRFLVSHARLVELDQRMDGTLKPRVNTFGWTVL